MRSPVDKIAITDSVEVQMDRTRPVVEKLSPRSNVHVVLTGPDGAIKYEEWGENLITDYGDDVIATRLFDDTIEIVTGMKLGTGVTAEAKNGAGATIVTYEATSNEALDAVATDATKGAGAGWRTTYVCTWIAGDVTEVALAEVVLTNETPLTDIAAVVGDTVARFVFASTIDKQVGDQLVVTWNVDILGA